MGKFSQTESLSTNYSHFYLLVYNFTGSRHITIFLNNFTKIFLLLSIFFSLALFTQFCSQNSKVRVLGIYNTSRSLLFSVLPHVVIAGRPSPVRVPVEGDQIERCVVHLDPAVGRRGRRWQQVRMTGMVLHRLDGLLLLLLVVAKVAERLGDEGCGEEHVVSEVGRVGQWVAGVGCCSEGTPGGSLELLRLLASGWGLGGLVVGLGC